MIFALIGIGFICFGLGWYVSHQAERLVYRKRLEAAQQTLDNAIASERSRVRIELSRMNGEREAFEALAKEKTYGFPWFADVLVEWQGFRDTHTARYLIEKSHPAYTAADTVKTIAAEKRELLHGAKTLEYKLKYLTSLFPWLLDFLDQDGIDDVIRCAELDPSETERDVDEVTRWLAPGEFERLSEVDRCQRALERFVERRKTKWEIGRDYERYVGWLYEEQGFAVEYKGIIDGIRDCGRDLICRMKGRTLIVQCKYWAEHKEIHEKHVCQLLGTLKQFEFVNGLSDVRGVLVTKTTLSETAREFASHLGIEVRENLVIGPYPMIKCNISASGEKIYHLPFDQQYDRTKISKKGEHFAFTVQDAYNKGFRRARRWRGP